MMNSKMILTSNNMIESGSFGSDLFSRWIYFLDASPKTKDTYTKAIKQFYIYLSENNITAPEREDIINFRESLKPDHKSTTIQLYITAIKLFFQWTESERIYPNVAEHIKGAKIDSDVHKREYLTEDQVKDLISSIDRSTLKGKRDYAMITLMILTGIRTISVIRADIGDVTTKGNHTVLYYQGKGHDEKAIYVKIPYEAEKALREYLNARRCTDPKAPLFASIANRNDGERMTTRSISRVVKERLIDIGIDSERYTAHSLRHTFGALSYLNGADITEIQLDMDHKSINTTQIYTHITDREKTSCGMRLAGAIFG